MHLHIYVQSNLHPHSIVSGLNKMELINDDGVMLNISTNHTFGLPLVRVIHFIHDDDCFNCLPNALPLQSTSVSHEVNLFLPMFPFGKLELCCCLKSC